MSGLGRLRPPYPVDHCANVDCPNEGSFVDEDTGESFAYLFRDLETNKLVTFCDDCSRDVEINHARRFLLVAL